MFPLITDCNQIKQDSVVDIHDLVDRYGISVSQMTTIMLRFSKSQPVVFLFMTCHRVCNKGKMTDATCGAGIYYPYGASWF
jgi:hypothetical protein